MEDRRKFSPNKCLYRYMKMCLVAFILIAHSFIFYIVFLCCCCCCSLSSIMSKHIFNSRHVFILSLSGLHLQHIYRHYTRVLYVWSKICFSFACVFFLFFHFFSFFTFFYYYYRYFSMFYI